MLRCATVTFFVPASSASLQSLGKHACYIELYGVSSQLRFLDSFENGMLVSLCSLFRGAVRGAFRSAVLVSRVSCAVAELDTAPHRRHGACSLVHTRTVVRVWPSHPQLIVHRRPIIFIYIPSQSLFIFGLSIYNPNARAPVTVNR